MNSVKKIVFISFGCLCAVLGIIGVFLPVLPTTPLLLAAAFFFSRSSERLNAWLSQTKIYKAYVAPFKESGCISLRKKAQILALSYAVMAVSAVLVQRPLVWGVLGAVAVFLLWLMVFHIPTEKKAKEYEYSVPVE